MHQQDGPQGSGQEAPSADRSYAVLPEPVRLEDTITSEDVAVVQDPYAGRDTETEFMLRHM